jgi:hypothetical protein
MENIDKFYYHLIYLRPIDIFYGHLVYFVVIWYIFPMLVCCTKKNLATLSSNEYVQHTKSLGMHKSYFPFFRNLLHKVNASHNRTSNNKCLATYLSKHLRDSISRAITQQRTRNLSIYRFEEKASHGRKICYNFLDQSDFLSC